MHFTSLKFGQKTFILGKKRENPLASDYNFPKLVCKPHKEMIHYTLSRKKFIISNKLGGIGLNRNKLI